MAFDLNKIIKSPKDLPSLPAYFYDILNALNDPDSSLADVASIVEKDLSLTTRILKLANSSFFTRSNRAVTIKDSLNIIGMDHLRNIVVSTALISQFKGIPEYFVTLESFWAHSVASGLAARDISDYKKSCNKETLYLAGIIHDIGSLIIYKEMPEQAEEALKRCNEWGHNLIDAEQSVFGFDHTEVGSALIEKWALPKIFKEITQHHHFPLKSKNYPVETAIVYLADYIVQSNQLGSSGEYHSPSLNQEVLRFLGLSEKDLGVISKKVIETFRETFNIVVS